MQSQAEAASTLQPTRTSSLRLPPRNAIKELLSHSGHCSHSLAAATQRLAAKFGELTVDDHSPPQNIIRSPGAAWVLAFCGSGTVVILGGKLFAIAKSCQPGEAAQRTFGNKSKGESLVPAWVGIKHVERDGERDMG
jgi:hypothetical protein